MKGIITKADILLGVALIILCIFLFRWVYSNGEAGAVAQVDVDGEIYGTYSLSVDQTVNIETDYGTNTLTVKDGKALMTQASCPDGYCLNQHKKTGGIDSSNQTIICLPNHLSVTIKQNGAGEDEGESVDAVAGTPAQ